MMSYLNVTNGSHSFGGRQILAKEELQRAPREFKGSVLLVSYEPEFYEGWVDMVWNIEDWTIKVI